MKASLGTRVRFQGDIFGAVDVVLWAQVPLAVSRGERVDCFFLGHITACRGGRENGGGWTWTSLFQKKNHQKVLELPEPVP